MVSITYSIVVFQIGENDVGPAKYKMTLLTAAWVTKPLLQLASQLYCALWNPHILGIAVKNDDAMFCSPGPFPRLDSKVKIYGDHVYI